MTKNEIKQQARIESLEIIRSEMLNNGYKENIGIISILKANIIAVINSAPIIILFSFIYFIKWGPAGFTYVPRDILLFVLLSAGGLVCLPAVHALTWSIFCKNGFKSIHLGFNPKSCTLYCYCKEPLTFSSYILGALMPLFVLGIGLFIFSFLTGSVVFLFFSLINILGTSGNITIAFMLLKYRNALIFDHPAEFGFIAYTK